MTQSRNHPDHEPDDDLLKSARQTLLNPSNTFTPTDWRTTMARAQSEANQKAMKAAQKKLGVRPPKMNTLVKLEDAVHETFQAAGVTGDGVAISQHVDGTLVAGDCAEQESVVESGFSIFNQNTQGNIMTEAKTESSNFPATKASPAQAEKERAAVAAIEAKRAKKEAAEKARAESTAAREAKAKERADKAASNKADREAKQGELKAAGRTYVGSMLTLAERVKAGAYVKSMTGQLRSTDELAEALDAVPPANVVILGVKALGLDGNPYVALNVGQQSMNLRNRMRGAIKKGTLTLATVKEIRDQDGLATAEAEAVKKQEAKAEREKKQMEAKAAKEVAAQKVIEDKKKSIDEKAKAIGQPKKADENATKPAAKKAKATA